jgi:hypothetical protein
MNRHEIKLVLPSRNAGKRNTSDGLSTKFFLSDNCVFCDTILGMLQEFPSNLVSIQSNQCSLMIIARHSHEGRELIIPHEGEVNFARLSNAATQQSLVLSGDLTGAEEQVHLPKGQISSGKYNQSRGVHTKPVNHHLVSPTTLGSVFLKYGLTEGRSSTGARNAEDTSGLINDDNVFILEDNLEVLSYERKIREKRDG